MTEELLLGPSSEVHLAENLIKDFSNALMTGKFSLISNLYVDVNSM